jgi:hypothetical protein
MFAVQFAPAVSVSPMWAWASLALVVGIYILAKLPRRISVAAGVAMIAAVGANPYTTQVIFNGIECCDLWWILYFICIPPQWGFC